MAMKIKRLINSMLLIVISIRTLPHLSAAVDPYNNYAESIWDVCGINEYKNGSAFQRNLNQLLDSLVGNVSASGFNTSSVVDGQNSNSTVYGLVQCGGDLGSSDCKLCAESAKERLVKICRSTSGLVQLNSCFLRYDSSNFFNHTNYISNSEYVCGRANASNPVRFTNTVGTRLPNISSKAVKSPKFFAAESFEEIYSPSLYIYSIAECYRDISRDSCQACLAYPSPSTFLYWCGVGATGAKFLSVNCQLRFETFPFFNISILSPAPAPGESLAPSSGKNGSVLSPLPSPPPVSSEGKRSNELPIILGVVATVVGSIAVIGLCRWNFVYRAKRWEHISRTTGSEIGGDGEISLSATIAIPELIFEYDILREATSNFNAERKLGEGGFGSVFRGVLRDRREVAVKRLKIGSSQGNAEFLNEVNLISRVQHRNLVKLLGCSVKYSERLLVYEYLHNTSLDKILFDATKRHLLDWKQRYEIIVGTARGLAYLHEESEIRIIHRDIKASNILLDNKYRPKIADFGLAKLFGEDESHVSTRVAGTLGYMAPEYALHAQLTEKADVFSFGVLVLEIISGRKNQSLLLDTEFLINGTWKLYKAERALEVMDPTMEGRYSWEEEIRVIKVGLLCTQAAAALRPSMSRVVSMLTSETEHLPSPTRPAFVDLDAVGAPDQVKPQRVIDPHKTSSTTATSSTTPSDIHSIHSAAVDPSSSILEPR